MSHSTVKKLEGHPKQVRQDRHILDDLGLTLSVGNQKFPIINFSYFGLAIEIENEDHSPAKSEKEILGTLLLENSAFQTVKLKKVRSSDQNDRLVIGFQTQGQYIDVEKLFCFADAIRQLREVQISSTKYSTLMPEIKFEIHELKNKLELFREKILHLEANRLFGSVTQKAAFEESVIDTFGPAMNEAIVESNLSLQKHFEKLTDAERPLGFEFFREQLKALIYESVFAERSYTKPRGYAGDFEMMSIIYRDDATGKTIFSRCMEKAMQLHPEPGAVRNRVSYLKTKILNVVETIPTRLNLLAVACGPAVEIREAVKEINPKDLERIDFYLLDQDVAALREAEKGIRVECMKLGVKEPRIHLLNINLKTVIKEGLDVPVSFDLIYSAGLFDYFTDPIARRVAEVLWGKVNDDGKLVIGNFNSTTPNKFGMLSLFDWHLILRTEEQMKELYKFSNTRVSTEFEPNGINIFSIIDKAD